MNKTDEEVVATRDDREMLLRPHLWPGQSPARVWVKRDKAQGHWRHTGLCWRIGARYMVKDHDWGDGDNRDLLKVEVLSYSTVDELLADGWVVD